MTPQAATLAYVCLILGLFWLDRDPKVRTSKALWIPVVWLLINGSRPVSEWLQSGPTIARESVEGSPLDAAVFGALIVAALVVLTSRRARVVSFLRTNAAILIFFSYCAVSTLWSDYPFVSFKRWTKAAGDVAMVLLVLTDLNPLAAIKRILTRTGFVLLPLSVLFIKYYPNVGRSYNPWTWLPMFGGVTLFKNMLGMTCLICGLGSVCCFVAAYRDRKGADRVQHLVPHAIVIAMAVWLFRTADSMTSFSCFVMASSVLVVTSVPRLSRKPAVAHQLVAAAVGLSLAALFLPGTGLVESLGRNPTLTGRTAIWSAVLSAAKNPLLGTGFESFWTGDRLSKVWDGSGVEKGIQEAHNGYLEIYLNLGWIGVSLIAVLILTGYRNIISLLRLDPEAGRVRLAFFTAGVIYSFTEAGFRMMSLVWIAFLLATMAVPQRQARKIRESALKATERVNTELTAENIYAHRECI